MHCIKTLWKRSGKQLTLLILLFGLMAVSSAQPIVNEDKFWNDSTSPNTIGNKIIKDLLARPEFMYYKTDFCTAVHYAEACAGFGAARLAGFLKDTVTLQKLEHRYAKVIDDSITNTANHVDANVYGILPLELFKQLGKQKNFNYGMMLANMQWENPLPNGLTNQTRYWIDDIYMIGCLQVQAYRVTGENIYLERAAMEIDSYLKKLQQPNGLFYHGSHAPFFWGRGNGWVAAGIAELISALPKNNIYYPSILDGYIKMMDALLSYQTECGMWRQLVDKPESWVETSATAMFGYAIALGVKNGLLNKNKYTGSYQRAWLALVKYINTQGQITDVCVGTGQSEDINYYLARPKIIGDLHGQAPMLWFAYSLLL